MSVALLGLGDGPGGADSIASVGISGGGSTGRTDSRFSSREPISSQLMIPMPKKLR